VCLLFLGIGSDARGGVFRAFRAEGPPNREELGSAFWTAIHSTAANFQPVATGAEAHALNFIAAIAQLYPCEECREHFRLYVESHPPNCSSRNEFLLWTCRAHNEVNERKSKGVFPCEINALDKRWGSCGCEEGT